MKKALLVIVLLCATWAAKAQTLALRVNASGTSAALVTPPPSIVVTGEALALSISCDTDATCAQVSLSIGPADDPELVQLDGSNPRVGTIERDLARGPLRISFGNPPAQIGTVQMIAGGGGNGGGNNADSQVAGQGSDLDACVGFTVTMPADDNVHFVVTPAGSIIRQPDERVDEDDTVVFHVIGSDPDVMRSLQVARTSATRQTGSIAVIGAGARLRLQSRGSRCFERTFELGDFAPGEATVEISTVAANNQKVVLGTTRFNVNKLWHGIMSFGPVWSNVSDRAYGLTPQGTGNVIVESEGGDGTLLYTAAYTYFVGGPRDIEKPRPKGSWRVNPTIGFALNDPADHALVGLGYDAGQFVITAGVHVARVDRLASGSGLTVGGPFTGTTVPTEKQLETGAFFAITIDARAARVLLDAILPSGNN